MAHCSCLDGWHSHQRLPGMCSHHLRGLSQMGCSAWKKGMANQSGASVVLPVTPSGLDLHRFLQSQNKLSWEMNTELGAAALLCLYKAAAPAEAGKRPSFFSSLYSDHWSSAMNQQKGHATEKQRESVRNSSTLNSRNSFGSSPLSSGNDKKLGQTKPESKDQETELIRSAVSVVPCCPPQATIKYH